MLSYNRMALRGIQTGFPKQKGVAMTTETTQARPLPWSHVGVQFDASDQPATVQAALAAADLDWGVELRGAAFRNAKGNWKVDPDRQYVVRSDTEESLGVVGRQYRPVSNAEAFGFADALAGEGGEYAAAWSERKGKRIGVAMKLGDPVELVEGDKSQRYLNSAKVPRRHAVDSGRGRVTSNSSARINCLEWYPRTPSVNGADFIRIHSISGWNARLRFSAWRTVTNWNTRLRCASSPT